MEGSIESICQAEMSESRPNNVWYRGAPANRYPSGAFSRSRSCRSAVRIGSESSRIAFPLHDRQAGRTVKDMDSLRWKPNDHFSPGIAFKGRSDERLEELISDLEVQDRGIAERLRRVDFGRHGRRRESRHHLTVRLH